MGDHDLWLAAQQHTDLATRRPPTGFEGPQGPSGALTGPQGPSGALRGPQGPSGLAFLLMLGVRTRAMNSMKFVFVGIFSRPSLAVTLQRQSSAPIVRGKVGCRTTPPVSRSLACTTRTPSSLFPIETTKRVSGWIPWWVIKVVKVQGQTKFNVSALTNSIL